MVFDTSWNHTGYCDLWLLQYTKCKRNSELIVHVFYFSQLCFIFSHHKLFHSYTAIWWLLFIFFSDPLVQGSHDKVILMKFLSNMGAIYFYILIITS